jgi:hypothetical protein
MSCFIDYDMITYLTDILLTLYLYSMALKNYESINVEYKYSTDKNTGSGFLYLQQFHGNVFRKFIVKYKYNLIL